LEVDHLSLTPSVDVQPPAGITRRHPSLFKNPTTLRLENLALRQQLGVLRRSTPKRLRLTATDRLFWAWLSQVWVDWRSTLIIVKPETVVGWHRKGFRLFWRWKIRHGKPGRPTVSRRVRDLIRTMSRANPLWGVPRIHGELLKLGIEISEPTVSKYIVGTANPIKPIGRPDAADTPRLRTGGLFEVSPAR
jgi:hypothetical protein